VSTPTERLVVLDDDVRQSIAATEQRCDVLRRAHARHVARLLQHGPAPALVEDTSQRTNERADQQSQEPVGPGAPRIEADADSADDSGGHDRSSHG